MKIIKADEFDAYWAAQQKAARDEATENTVREIIAAVRAEGDAALRRFSAKFDKCSRAADKNFSFEVPAAELVRAEEDLKRDDPGLFDALMYAAGNIRRFAELQKEGFKDFEVELQPGLFTGQKIIPVSRAGIYAPGGRFPLISTVLMGVIPALVTGVNEVVLVSPPCGVSAGNLPDRRILAAARLSGAHRVFSIGGAQAIAALAYGTETVPRCDIIAGPGNRYVAAAKRLVSGDVGIDLPAGPTDVLVITGALLASGLSPRVRGESEGGAVLAAADLMAQAEHDPDARARAIVPEGSEQALITAVEAALADAAPPAADSPAQRSLDSGGLIITVPRNAPPDVIARIANAVAPEHLELQCPDIEIGKLIPLLKNYGSLFVGSGAAEVLGDYSAGLNHTLPTGTAARFTGGLSVRNFLKTVTTLRTAENAASPTALEAAQTIARAEGLAFHARAAEIRIK